MSLTNNAKNYKKSPASYLKWLILALILAVAGYFAYQKFQPQTEKVEYLTGKVELGTIENSVMASGKIQAIKTVDVGAQVSGEITQLFVEVGDFVKKGDIIAQISQLEQKNIVANAEVALFQAQANLAQAEGDLLSRQGEVASAAANITTKQAELKKAQASFDRLQGLIQINAISQEEYDNAKAAVEIAKAALASAEASHQNSQNSVNNAKLAIESQRAAIIKAKNDMANAQEDLSHTTIRAPMDGVVTNVAQKQGTTVNANQSAPTIVTLADLSRVRINTQISEADIVHIKPMMPARFNIIGAPDQKYDAVLSGIEPAPNSSSSGTGESAVYYIGYLDVDNADGKFRIDMTAQVNIIIDQAKDVLVIPAAAIENKDGKSIVRIVGEDGNAKPIEVQTGINNRVNTEIKSGLQRGDTIILGESKPAEKSGSNNRNRPPMM